MTADASGAVSHAGTELLGELAERTGLRAEFSIAVDGVRSRGGGHAPGQVLVDLAAACVVLLTLRQRRPGGHSATPDAAQ